MLNKSLSAAQPAYIKAPPSAHLARLCQDLVSLHPRQHLCPCPDCIHQPHLTALLVARATPHVAVGTARLGQAVAGVPGAHPGKAHTNTDQSARASSGSNASDEQST